MIDTDNAKIIKYQFEFPISRCADVVWASLINDIDAWWLNDFRALGEGSNVSLSAEAGGLLVESTSDGSSLEWYRVQMVSPGKSIHLVGYLAPDWGGPTISMIKLSIENKDECSTFIVSDALMGNVSEASASSAEAGWKALFGDGLKSFLEK